MMGILGLLFRPSVLLLFLLIGLNSGNLITIHPVSECNPDDQTPDFDDCLSLDDALSMLSDNDIIYLSHGSYTLHTFSPDVVQDLSNVSIIGDSSHPEDVVVRCLEGVGLFFFNVTDLTISGITIEQCGLTGEEKITTILSVTRELIDIVYEPLADFSAALFLVHTPNLKLTDVTIQDNRGFGIVGINMVGSVNFYRVHVLQNYPSNCVIDLEKYSDSGGSGGGVFILYQDYVYAELTEENHHNFHFPNLTTYFNLSLSNVSDNYVCRLNLFHVLHDKLSRSIQNPLSLNLSMIGAGGVTFSLMQSSYHVQGLFNSCNFHNNSGTYNGAAMQITQYESNNMSHVTIKNSNFHHNGEHLNRVYGDQGLGPAGAILIWFYTPNPITTDNHITDITAMLLSQEPSGVTISNSLFRNNTARSGGAVCIISFGPEISIVQDKLVIENSEFSYNQADFGGALYLTELSYSAFDPGLNVKLHNVNITRNLKRDRSAGKSLQTNSGIIDINFLNITLSGNNYISHNQDTAISLHSGILTVSGSNLMEHNVGSTGGAISLASESYLVLREFVNVTFFENTAVIAGGAIYVDFDFTRVSEYDCFVFFKEIDFFCDLFHECSKDLPIIFVHFVNNTAPLGSAIYGSTFTNCPWAQGSYVSHSSNISIIVQHLNAFEPFLTVRPPLTTKSNIFNTLPRSIRPDSEDNSPYFEVMPGQEFETSLGAFDQLDQAVPLTIFSKVTRVDNKDLGQAIASIGATDRYLLANAAKYTTVPVKVFGNENVTYRLSIISNEAQVEFSFIVKLKQCPIGFIYNSTRQHCECEVSQFLRDVTCDNTGHILIPLGSWIGYIDGSKYAQSQCVLNYCNLNTSRIFLNDPDKQCKGNRSGILCGQCQDGYSRVLSANSCEVCSNNYLALILPFAVLGLFLVVLISLLNITITDGYINGFIFYCNIMGLLSSLSTSTVLDEGIIKVVVSIINLNLGIKTCFYNGMTDIQLTFLNFVFPLYLGAILILITLFSKYVHSKQLAKLLSKINITHVFATLLLLSYTSIIRTCIDVLNYVYVNVDGVPLRKWGIDPNIHYFTGLHIFLFFVSIFFLLVLLPFPLLLLFPRITLRLPYIVRMKPLIDAFIAPLNNRQLYWVGFRILCRIVFFLLTLLDDKPRYLTLCILIIAITVFEAYIKPFKTTFRNLLDLSIMLNLIVMTLLTVVSSFHVVMDTALTKTIIVFLSFFALEFLLVVVYYILIVIPCSEMVMQKVKTYIENKSKNLNIFQLESRLEKKDRNANSRSTVAKQRTMRKGSTEDQLTHSSFECPLPERGDFSSTSFIGYRESMFEASIIVAPERAKCNRINNIITPREAQV